MEKYENPIRYACDVQDWIANGWAKPEGFCNGAWDSISAFVMTLAGHLPRLAHEQGLFMN